MAERPDTTNDEQSEELVAYLDGELDDASRRRVEERLSTDPRARDELHRLERAWNLLDELPRATANESFTSTTVGMIATAAAEDLEQTQAKLPARRVGRWALAIFGAVAAGLCGAMVVSWVSPNPNAALLRDLPVLENMELYRQADSVEFLKKLHDEGLFSEEADDGS